jgi:hypothetical protein
MSKEEHDKLDTKTKRECSGWVNVARARAERAEPAKEPAKRAPGRPRIIEAPETSIEE